MTTIEDRARELRDALRAEIKRLREALEALADERSAGSVPPHVQTIARAALEQSKGGDANASGLHSMSDATRAGVAAGPSDDPTASVEWNEGCDYAMTQLCGVLKVDPKSISWDAATETLEGDVGAVISRILAAGLGNEDWMLARTIPSDAQIAAAATAAKDFVQTRPFFNLKEGLAPVLAGSLSDAWVNIMRAALTAAMETERMERKP